MTRLLLVSLSFLFVCGRAFALTPEQVDVFELTWQEAVASIQVNENCRAETRHALILDGHTVVRRSDELLLMEVCFTESGEPYVHLIDTVDLTSPKLRLLDLDRDGATELLLEGNPSGSGGQLYVYGKDTYLDLKRISSPAIGNGNSQIEFTKTEESIVIETISTFSDKQGGYTRYTDRYQLIDGRMSNISSVTTRYEAEEEDYE